MSLPAEILDCILSFLQSDTPTLKACSRSHPIISQLVERYLYSNVTLQDTGGNEILEVLHNRPHIANYIHVLEIEFVIVRNAMKFLEEIAFILPKMSMIRRIGLKGNRFHRFNWQELPEKFRLAFLDCLSLPSVTVISTRSISFSLAILRHCKHIQHLSLQRWQDDCTVLIGRDDNTCFPTIGSLALHDCGWRNSPSSASTISSWMQSHHLSFLEFSDTSSWEDNFDVLSRILISCSHSLTSLIVDIGQRYGSRYDDDGCNTVVHPDKAIPIPLSGLRNLQQLTIRAQPTRLSFSYGNWKFFSPIFAIAQVLKPASSLKQLTLEFKILFTFYNYQEAQHHITNVFCTALHSLLVQTASTIDVVCFRLKSIPREMSIPLSSNAILSMFVGHCDLVQFVDNGKLILTPVD